MVPTQRLNVDELSSNFRFNFDTCFTDVLYAVK